jgi:hypothetical protein
MKYSEYKKELENIAQSNNIGGPAISSIISSLSYSLYNNEMQYVNIIKEANLLTASSLNSIIVHGASKGYSVFRGQNIIYKISGLNPVQNTSVKKFDLFIELEGYELRYNQDYSFERMTNSGTEGISIDVVLCKKNNYKGLTKSSNKYNTYIPQSDVSQSLLIFDDLGLLYELYDSYEDYLTNVNLPPPSDLYNNKKLIITTYTSYSFTITNPYKTENDTYVIKYLVYDNFVNLDLSTLKETIKDFDILDGFSVSSSNTFKSREDDIDLLRYKIQNSFKSNFIVKSNDDLEFVTKDYFQGTMTGLNIIKDSDGITIYYKTMNGLEIPPATVTLFKDYLKLAYYIYDNISMQLSLKRDYNFTVTVYYNDNISLAIKSLSTILSSYEEKIGLKFNPYFLLGNINDSEYIYSIDSKLLITDVIELQPNEYLSFIQTISYINSNTI